jgi:HD superfamily phosphohydrolase
MPQSEHVRIRKKLEQNGGALWKELSFLSEEWLKPVLQRLEDGEDIDDFPKSINDPVWGPIQLFPWELTLLDSPLLQRLRGVRQLGMAHYVYPGATHDRFAHSIGVVEAAERMVRALTRNAQHRDSFQRLQGISIPLPNDEELRAVRLAGLLHDIGHGPYSHASEPIIEARNSENLQSLHSYLLQEFEGSTQIQTSEILSVLLI